MAAPGPLLVVASLAGGDEVDATTVSYLLKAALVKKKKEEERKVQERKEQVMQDIHRKIHANEVVSEAEWAAWRAWHGIGSFSSGGQKRKRKKRRKRKLPRNSSCPRLAARHLGRFGPEGHLCRDTVTALVARAVRTWKPGTPEEHRKIWSFLGDHHAEFYDPSYMAVTCSAFVGAVQDYGLFWKMTSAVDSRTALRVAGFTGDDTSRAVFLFFAPKMLGILVDMDQKDSYGDVGKDCALALLGVVLDFIAECGCGADGKDCALALLGLVLVFTAACCSSSTRSYTPCRDAEVPCGSSLTRCSTSRLCMVPRLQAWRRLSSPHVEKTVKIPQLQLVGGAVLG